jgi:hypothetical protein
LSCWNLPKLFSTLKWDIFLRLSTQGSSDKRQAPSILWKLTWAKEVKYYVEGKYFFLSSQDKLKA